MTPITAPRSTPFEKLVLRRHRESGPRRASRLPRSRSAPRSLAPRPERDRGSRRAPRCCPPAPCPSAPARSRCPREPRRRTGARVTAASSPARSSSAVARSSVETLDTLGAFTGGGPSDGTIVTASPRSSEVPGAGCTPKHAALPDAIGVLAVGDAHGEAEIGEPVAGRFDGRALERRHVGAVRDQVRPRPPRGARPRPTGARPRRDVRRQRRRVPRSALAIVAVVVSSSPVPSASSSTTTSVAPPSVRIVLDGRRVVDDRRQGTGGRERRCDRLEVAAHLERGLGTHLAIAVGGARDESIELGRDRRHGRARHRHPARQVLVRDRHRGLAGERQLPGQQLVAHDAERVEVAARVGRLTADLLGRQVLHRAGHGAGLRSGDRPRRRARARSRRPSRRRRS